MALRFFFLFSFQTSAAAAFFYGRVAFTTAARLIRSSRPLVLLAMGMLSSIPSSIRVMIESFSLLSYAACVLQGHLSADQTGMLKLLSSVLRIRLTRRWS